MGRAARECGSEARSAFRVAARRARALQAVTGPRDATSASGCPVASNGTDCPRDREYVRGRLQPSGLPARALFAAGHPCPLDRRSARSRGARPRDEGDRRAAGPCRQPDRGPAGSRARRAVPPSGSRDAARGTCGAALCAPECPAARGEARCGARGAGPSRSGVVRAVVRRVEVESGARIGREERAARRPTRRCPTSSLALDGGLASSRIARSRGRSRMTTRNRRRPLAGTRRSRLVRGVERRGSERRRRVGVMQPTWTRRLTPPAEGQSNSSLPVRVGGKIRSSAAASGAPSRFEPLVAVVNAR